MMTRAGSLAAALPFLLASAVVRAQPAAEREQITLKVEAPQEGEQFACRIPVTVSHPEGLDLQKLHVVAKAFDGNIELSSTGIETDGRPLVRDRGQQRIEYAPAPVQFDLAKQDCERITGLGIVLANCTLADGAQEDCLDRIRFQPEQAGEIAFFIGEPAPPARQQ